MSSMSGKALLAELERDYAAKWSGDVEVKLKQMGIDGDALARSIRRHMVDIRPTMSAPPRSSATPSPKADHPAG